MNLHHLKYRLHGRHPMGCRRRVRLRVQILVLVRVLVRVLVWVLRLALLALLVRLWWVLLLQLYRSVRRCLLHLPHLHVLLLLMLFRRRRGQGLAHASALHLSSARHQLSSALRRASAQGKAVWTHV